MSSLHSPCRNSYSILMFSTTVVFIWLHFWITVQLKDPVIKICFQFISTCNHFCPKCPILLNNSCPATRLLGPLRGKSTYSITYPMPCLTVGVKCIVKIPVGVREVHISKNMETGCLLLLDIVSSNILKTTINMYRPPKESF